MRCISRLAIVAVLALFVAGCSDDDNGKTDGQVKDDIGVKPDTGPPPTKLECNNDCVDLVMSAITLPDATTASKIGHDYDGDGSVDNALGGILGGLSSMVGGSLNVQEAVEGGVNAGKTLVLMRLQADDWASDDSSKAQAWVGAEMSCCSNPDDKAACATEAKANCFNGSTTFYPASDSPTDAIFGGAISGGKAVYGPSSLKFILPFTGAGDLVLNLKSVYLKGDVAADGKSITNGILAGLITQDDLNNNLIPTIKDMLNDTLNDPTQDPQVLNIITSLFDGNSDGTITEDEVKNSTVVSTFLGGDVDIDNDGVKELSLGVGFEAVSATIDEAGTPPDAGPTPDTGATPDAGAPDAAAGD